MFVRNTTATASGNSANPDLLQVSTSFFTGLLVANPAQASGLLINSRTNAYMRLEVTGDSNNATVEFSNIAADGIRLNGDGGDIQAVVTNTTFGPGAGNLGGGIESVLTSDSTLDFNFSGNDITIKAVGAVELAGVRVAAFDTATFDGDVTSNTIRNAANTSTIFGVSMKLDQGSGSGNSKVDIASNTITVDAMMFGGRGIDLQSGGTGGRRLDAMRLPRTQLGVERAAVLKLGSLRESSKPLTTKENRREETVPYS